jgi:serine/threonine protein kinase
MASPRYLGADDLDGEPVLIALGSPQQRERTELGVALTLVGPGIVPLRGIAELIEPNESPLSALIEDAPSGVPLASLALPLSLADAVGLGIALARVIKHVHAQDRIVRGIRPELVYVDEKRLLSGLAPRCELFWSLAPAPGYGVAPCFEQLYLAPEIVAGRDAVPASDVFSLCALLAHVASGEHPFAAASMMGQITAIATGKRVRWTGPEVLAGMLDAGLAVDPAKRPSPARVIEALEKTRPS